MLFRRSAIPEVQLPPGERIYAIGDVHGERDLLAQALQSISVDNARRGSGRATLVLLGDLIDRGSDAADLLMTFSSFSNDRLVILKGNHEAALVQAYNGDEQVLGDWLPFGAAATLTGLGLTDAEIWGETGDLLDAMRARIPPALIEWLDALPTHWESGDYYFTHAGIRPGRDLDEQEDEDLLWMREPFLSSRRFHGKVVIHGHSIEPGRPKLGGNRIGLDTGAHEYGVLSALGLEGDRQWLIQSQRLHTQPTTLQDIEGLVAGITGTDASAARSLNLAMPVPDRIPVRATVPWRRPRQRFILSTSGVVAAGFALVAALVGAGYLLFARVDAGGSTPAQGASVVSLAIPAGSPSPPALASPGKASPRIVSKRWNRRPYYYRRRYNRVSGNAGDGPPLTGAALDQALTEDREQTRQRNIDEATRMPPAKTGEPR